MFVFVALFGLYECIDRKQVHRKLPPSSMMDPAAHRDLLILHGQNHYCLAAPVPTPHLLILYGGKASHRAPHYEIEKIITGMKKVICIAANITMSTGATNLAFCGWPLLQTKSFNH